jgi:UDP-N-acetylglucosamine 2-epimerase (non-hydrolysing)
MSNLVFFVGTSAELLKIYPVVKRLPRETVKVVSSGQQDHEMKKLLKYLDIEVEFNSFSSREMQGIENVRQAVGWSGRYFIRLCWDLIAKKRIVKKFDAIVVHGDTLTCFITSFAAFLTGRQLIHVEAGLRSGSILHPFPEEITRRVVSRIADTHYVPNESSLRNLQNCKGRKILTSGNTGLDTVYDVTAIKPLNINIDGEFLLLSLHRNELFDNRQVLGRTIDEILEISKSNKIILVCDKRFRVQLDLTISKSQIHYGDIQITTKLVFPEFKYLLERCRLLITDSGGQQEEAAALGISCLVHRKFTERSDGIDANITLSKWETGAIIKFVKTGKKAEIKKEWSSVSPSKIVAESLLEIMKQKNDK